MVQRARMLATESGNLSSIPKTHIVKGVNRLCALAYACLIRGKVPSLTAT